MKELDLVRLTEPVEDLPAGTVATVLAAPASTGMLLLEVADEDGRTISMPVVERGKVELVAT